VIQDIAAIIGDNDALTPHVAAALKEYNLAQMTTVEHAAEGEVPAHVVSWATLSLLTLRHCSRTRSCCLATRSGTSTTRASAVSHSTTSVWYVPVFIRCFTSLVGSS
jgi:hypothetical protein